MAGACHYVAESCKEFTRPQVKLTPKRNFLEAISSRRRDNQLHRSVCINKGQFDPPPSSPIASVLTPNPWLVCVRVPGGAFLSARTQKHDSGFFAKNTIHHVRGNENTTIKFKWWHGREADDDDDDDDGDGDISGSGEEGGEE